MVVLQVFDPPMCCPTCVFRALAQAVDAGKDGYVVLDTAPTGHTILLLDAALAYHRELSRQATQMPLRLFLRTNAANCSKGSTPC